MIKRFLVLLLALSLCTSFISCSKDDLDDNDDNDVGVSDNYEDDDLSADENESEKIKYKYVTQYIDVNFVSDDKKLEWKTALVNLLNNRKMPVYDDGGCLLDYYYLYPDRPCIKDSSELALFDINTDGTPELLVNLGGGSSGNAYYYVYDILSGEEIGTLNGGHNASWCTYFNQSTGSFESICNYDLRSGWMGKIRIVNKATLGATRSDNKPYLHETNLMYAYYTIDAVEVDLTPEDIEYGVDSAFDEIYTNVDFYVNSEKSSISKYFEAQDNFIENYVRISETAIQLIYWSDVTNSDDDAATRAEKMAQALISSSQKFVLSPQSNIEAEATNS